MSSNNELSQMIYETLEDKGKNYNHYLHSGVL